MAWAKDILRTGPAWSASVLATTVMASIIQSWQVQSGLINLGAEVPAGLALETAFQDFTGLALPVLAVFGIALALAFALAGWLKPKLPILAPIAWPLAGAAAIGTTLGFMHAQFQTTPLAGARGPDGFILFCAAGAMGGAIFAWLKPRSS
ncbi:MAG: hypothetical protein ACOYO0_00600 [Sandarakinorhabdus sp.]|jgi:hypothetical protein